ncbi:kinesin [Delitschia confertaspora ATCC 74209]|uniref:Kinesin n=1 Tax=Delitschia confertaspora ATCC 74209 TaxID=1513339 RepID=A0A9P4MR93_9PLEO|nr:kinesin [Delitschia confertaspora ATCC 74209]
MASSPPGSPAGAIQRPMSAMIRSNRSSSRMSMSSKHGGSRASDEDSRTAVKVAVRVRPPLKSGDPGFDLIPQRFRGSTCQVTSASSLAVDASGGRKVFVFDRVFGEDVDQDGVFDYVSESVNSFVQGYNVSILAYGQSGAGKSYTMGTTGPRDQGDAKVMGIIPRAAAVLFEKIEGHSGNRASGSGIRAPSRISMGGVQSFARPSVNKNWQLKATYVEIYNEQLRDLLLPETTQAHERPTVSVREDAKGRILLTGLTQVPINSVEDLLDALNHGSAIRQTDATAVNAKSSRSHAVFSLNLVQKKSAAAPLTTKEKRMSVPIEAMSGGSENWITVDSKLHFVDLAGSERLKNTQAQGERAKEGISINAGLASLGKVISQLSSRSSGSHVSYRDSKLTRLLQDSLGGNAITYMIACVNPAEFHLSETLNTVQYAQRARAIQSKPQIQQISNDSDKQAVIERLRAEVSFLRDQIRLSERTDRKKNAPHERAERQQEREAELQNQLLDVQENYTALSTRHAKLISEITKARDSENAETPMLKDAIGDSALERLKRSNSFAEAVESVVLEYEKTIQTLESSLSNTRSSLSASESELLEKETRIAFLESQAQQLQSRIQKAIDREASNEEYVKTLEAQVDSSASGIEKNDTMISDLREKLQKARENEASCEDYISTLEERLAENEQEVDLMQREIERLKHVVERQRSIGKLDNLLYELDNIRQTDAKGEESPIMNGHSPSDSDPFVEKRFSGESSGQYSPQVDAITEEEGSERPSTPGAEAPDTTVGTYEQRKEDNAPAASGFDLAPEEPMDVPQSPAQSKYVADKLESVTQELFDLRVEHEATVQDYDKLESKYQEALKTMAELRDTIDEARLRRPSLTASTRPVSFLAEAGVNGLKEEDGQPSASRTLSSELSLAGESPNTSNMGDDTYPTTEASDAETAQNKSNSNADSDINHDESALAHELKMLKKLNAEKEERVVQLNQSYAELQEQHQDTLDFVEELKSEVHKAQMAARPASPTASAIIRRKSSQNVLSNDRANRAYTSLRNIALDNFENKPDTVQNFELNLTAIMTELQSRSERVQSLETEIATVRKEMEGKMTLINGLAKERSSFKASSPLDISIVAQMQDQIKQSEDQMNQLKELHAQREQELQDQVNALRASLDNQEAGTPMETPHDVPGAFMETPLEVGEAEAQLSQVNGLQKEVAEWRSKHMEAIEAAKRTERNHLGAIQEFQTAIKALEAEHAARIADIEKSKVGTNNASRLAELEQSHANILRQVEADAEARALTEKELDTHRSLVFNLEKQIEEHKSAIDIHQNGLDSLKQSHTAELESISAQLAEQQSSNQALQAELNQAQSEMEHLFKGVASALGEDTDTTRLQSQIETLVGDRKSLEARVEQATSDLESARSELKFALDRVQKLQSTVGELEMINNETVKELEKVAEKERKSSRLVQELEDQLNQNWDQHEAANNRLSALQTERSRELEDALQRKENVEREVEESRVKIALLESQLADAKRISHRESIDPRGDLQRSNSNNSNLRKSTSHTSLPSPPPAIPLPPLPGSPPPTTTSAPSPPTSRHQSKDIAQAQLVEDQEARIRTIEKHLFAEKQLTATLEDALTDLEASSQKTKSEMESFKKKCASLESELEVMRKERSLARHSLQAVEEERTARLRVEAERAQLEARMAALNKSNQKKKSAFNCF